MTAGAPIYGFLAEFESSEALVAAAESAREAGYRKMDAYSPFPIEELSEALHLHERKLPILVLIGGLAGCAVGFGLQYYVSVIAYPVNVGGRPMASWPSFVPVSFELTILVAALCAVFGMLLMNGLPMPYHPLFNSSRFSLASSHAFFLCIEASDKQFNREETARFLLGLQAKGVDEVEL
jgi:hypothetical protein